MLHLTTARADRARLSWAPMTRRVPALRSLALEAGLLSAAFYRQRLKNVTFIAVTGSCGKTTTKNLIAAILGSRLPGKSTRGTENSLTDVGKTVLRATRRDSFCVVEVATWGRGTVSRAARVVAPNIAVVTNVGPAHLEPLRTIESVAAAKAELIAAVPTGGTLIVPAREPLLAPYLRDDLRILTFGEEGDVRLAAATGGDVQIDLPGQRIRLEVFFDQAHIRRDLLAAVAVAYAFGLDPTGVVPFKPAAGRGRRTALPGDVTLIDDCYNANPLSMRAALEDLAAVAAQDGHQRRVAVLGDMLELGEDERELHLQMGEQAAGIGVDVLITVGPRAAVMADRFDGEVRSLNDAAQAAVLVPQLLRARDVVLVKGSRSVGLERVCGAICSTSGSGASLHTPHRGA